MSKIPSIEVTVKVTVEEERRDITKIATVRVPHGLLYAGLPTVSGKALSQAVQAAFFQCGGVIEQ